MPADNPETADSDRELSTDEVLGWLEFACWTTIILVPFLYYVNGPAVSQDQFIVRAMLVCIAMVGALILTGRRLVRARRTKATQKGAR